MALLFLDESIHEEYGFMIIAYVLCEASPNEIVKQVITECDVPEYHSCTTMKSCAAMQKARRKLAGLLNGKVEYDGE